jgi:DNA-binding response OmpR family regulator
MAHILVLESDKLLSASLKSYLTAAKYTVSIHGDPQAAVLSADKRLPNIVITELLLAGRSGVEFLYEFRSYPDWQAIPVIVFTAMHSEELAAYKEVLQELNVQTILYKPTTSLARLAASLERCLAPATV